MSLEEDEDVAAISLFDMSRLVVSFYESPVIFFTSKDFSDTLFNIFCSIRTGILENNNTNEIVESIIEYHIQWLHAVSEIEKFKNNIRDIPKEEIYNSISYTKKAMCSRLKYFQRYIDKYRSCLSNQQHQEMRLEQELVEEMHNVVSNALLEQLKCFKAFTGDIEFIYKTENKVEELFQWLDQIHDGFSLLLCKYFKMHDDLDERLKSTYYSILDQFIASGLPSVQKVKLALSRHGLPMGYLIRYTANHDLEMSILLNKMYVLEDCIKYLHKNQKSAKKEYQHQREYLDDRLRALENTKTTIKQIHTKIKRLDFENLQDEELCPCFDYFRLRIFQHLLPVEQRQLLVTELCQIWDNMLSDGKTSKAIFKVVDQKYEDELGRYYIDCYNRHIYFKHDDKIKYQANEKNELVPLNDSGHIYFYDKYGRYYVEEEDGRRIYKANDNASEYMMDSCGSLLKINEEIAGQIFYFNHLGRYYIDNNGKRIYQETDSLSEFESDGLGNLVRIRSHSDLMVQCLSSNSQATEDCKYLKLTVGKALCESITSVILRQPEDPINFLSEALLKFRENIEIREDRAREQEALDTERQIKAAEEKAEQDRLAMELHISSVGSEAEFDENLEKYDTEKKSLTKTPTTNP